MKWRSHPLSMKNCSLIMLSKITIKTQHSVGTTLPPSEKLKKYFDIEVNRELFEDAMDIVKLRIDELNKLENKDTSNS